MMLFGYYIDIFWVIWFIGIVIAISIRILHKKIGKEYKDRDSFYNNKFNSTEDHDVYGSCTSKEMFDPSYSYRHDNIYHDSSDDDIFKHGI